MTGWLKFGSWLLILATLLSCGCNAVPITGRKQVLLVPEAQERSLGLSSFQEVTKKEPASENAKYIELVNRVGKRIADVAERPDFQWEFRVIKSDTQNAFCLPGGKVAVYEGIIPVCTTEAGLAVVMSHEVAHALARHGGERMTQNMAVNAGKQALSYLTLNQTETRQAIIQQVYGAGTKYGVLLPYSRTHESEADHIGLMLMAKAGYDPREAPRFWTRFGGNKKDKESVEFMSTHPSDEHRARDLANIVPEALTLYEKSPQQFGLGEPIDIPDPVPATTPAAAPTTGSNPLSLAPSLIPPRAQPASFMTR